MFWLMAITMSTIEPCEVARFCGVFLGDNRQILVKKTFWCPIAIIDLFGDLFMTEAYKMCCVFSGRELSIYLL